MEGEEEEEEDEEEKNKKKKKKEEEERRDGFTASKLNGLTKRISSYREFQFII